LGEGPIDIVPALFDRDGRILARDRQRASCWRLAAVAGAQALAGTIERMVPALAAIFFMLALGVRDQVLGDGHRPGLAFTRTGPMLYPIFGTMLGWLASP
jgi:L-lactate permease